MEGSPHSLIHSFSYSFPSGAGGFRVSPAGGVTTAHTPGPEGVPNSARGRPGRRGGITAECGERAQRAWGALGTLESHYVDTGQQLRPQGRRAQHREEPQTCPEGQGDSRLGAEMPRARLPGSKPPQNPNEWEVGAGGQAREAGDVRVPIVDSCFYMAEINTVL